MNLKIPIPIMFVAIFLVPCQSSDLCNQTCGGRTLPFPFGFSSACHIQLNCSADAAILAAGFPVQSITSDTIIITVSTNCGRPVEALAPLFTRNYAPTSLNAVLMQNCSHQPESCFIPATKVRTNFQFLNCGGGRNDSISCYSEASNQSGFLDYKKFTKTGCRSLLSAISTNSFPSGSSPVSLDVQIMRIGWWLLGECQCSANARCVNVTTSLSRLSNNPTAYRCQCLEGFVGDGFPGGYGCRKESQRCTPSNYILGHCGGTARIVVLSGGVAAGALLIAGFTVFCFIRSRSKLRKCSSKVRKLCNTTGIIIPVYPYKQIAKATDNFSSKRRLGNGAYGTVYSGKLNRDEWVAIKRIRHRDADSIQQVINEIKLISTVSHPNLVQLLGCCIDTEEQILVYEFMPNGTLSQHLQRERGDGLPWQVRLSIAAETASAIAHLHTMQPPVYHRDVKSGNILLDYNYKSKVADFGLSREGMVELSHVSTAPQGTPGYLDPQYHQQFQLSDKSDVYSFGVVLAEIITGMRAVDFARPEYEVNLAGLAVDRIGTGRVDEIIDPFILEPDGDRVRTVSTVQKVAELAFRCLAFARDMRPSMMEVAMELEQIGKSKSTDHSSETISCSSSSTTD